MIPKKTNVMNLPSSSWLTSALAGVFLTLFVPSAHATNGMNLEGYGPEATAMGGASIAFDNGTAAVMNNPATLGLLEEGARLDLAVGVLGPDVTAVNPIGEPAKSQSTAFFMPAIGYTRRSGDIVYGFGVFGQGGMGCEYEPDSWRGLGFDLENRTEVSVGRAIAPIAWNVNDRLILAATADFVWAGMDLKMAMSGSQFIDLVTPSMQQFGRASGSLVQSFGQMLQGLPMGSSVDYAYFDFSNGNDFTGESQGYGYAGKLGLLYKASDDLSFGFTYHSETALSDLKAPNNRIAFQLNVPGMGAMAQSLVGDINVVDFQWPGLVGAGFAWRPADRWLVAADVRHVMWSRVMDSFHMTFTAADVPQNGPFAGQVLDSVLYQDWDDQTVVMLGLAYQATDRLTLRIGGNYGSNPIPDRYLNCLFPAIVEKHITVGFGWAVSPDASIDFSYTHGFEATRTSGYGVTAHHSQNNAQLMYSIKL